MPAENATSGDEVSAVVDQRLSVSNNAMIWWNMFTEKEKGQKVSETAGNANRKSQPKNLISRF